MSLSYENRINSMKQLKEWLRYELSKYPKAGIKGFLANSEAYILRKHQFLLRCAEYYTNVNNKLLSLFFRFLLIRHQNKYCIHIGLNCCGKGLKLMHVGPFLFNGDVTVGEDCTFHILSNLVAGGNSDQVPVLGNRVIMGIGSTVVGNVYIADDVAIGAHSLVNKSILECDVTVAGVPAKKIKNIGRSAWKKERRNCM